MNSDEGSHNYLVIGIAALLAILLLGPYFGLHIFSTKPEVIVPPTTVRRPQINATARIPKPREKTTRREQQQPVPRRKMQETNQNSGESLSAIEDLLK